jgi:hypothetical protein
MAGIKFCFEYRNNQKVYLPVNPTKLEIQSPGNNATLNIVNLGDTSILKTPGLKLISFETFIPTQNSGSYVERDIQIYASEFYKDFFEAVMAQKEPINFVVEGLNVALKMSIEDFTYRWEGGDPDMHFKISLKEYRQSTIKTTNIGSSSTATTNKGARENSPKIPTPGSKVRVNGVLHRDSYGSSPGATEKGEIRLVEKVKAGRPYPYHIITLFGAWRGWVNKEALEVIE